MARLTVLLSLLLLLAVSLLSSSFAQPSSAVSPSLHKLRGAIAAATRLPYTVAEPSAAEPLLAPGEAEGLEDDETEAADMQLGIASILPYRSPDELLQAENELDGPTPSLTPSWADEHVRAAELASQAEARDRANWTGEVASILPYRETDADELRETAEEDEEGELGEASVVPFDSKQAVDSSDDDLSLSTLGEEEESVSSSAARAETEWAKRSRVRRFRLRRWLLQKRLGAAVIYSQ